MENRTIITPCGSLSWLVPNQIIREMYVTPANLDGTKKHNQLLINHFSANGSGVISLSDIRQLKKNPSKEVRDYFASDEVAKLHKATAILVNSGFTKALGNLYLKFSKPKYPTRLFTDEEKATEWLKSFL